MSSAHLEFYFDFVSPYSYIAFTLLQRLQQDWNISIEYKPVRLAHIMKLAGSSPPGGVTLRLAFLAKDLRRTCAAYGIPFHPPSNFLQVAMKNSAYVVVAAQAEGFATEKIEEIMGAIWGEFFGRGCLDHFTDNLDDLHPLLAPLLSAEGAGALLERAASAEILAGFMANTEGAAKRGAFGVPTMIVRKRSDGEEAEEFFFGSDRFHHIAQFLGKDPALPPFSKL